MSLQLQTENRLDYVFFRKTAGIFQFRIRATNDAHLILSSRASTAPLPVYEVFIGGWRNTKSVIRKNLQKPDVVEVSTPRILNGNEFRGFWIRWNNGAISAGHEGRAEPFLSFPYSQEAPLEYVGVCTGWGATGSWIIKADGDNIFGGAVQPSRHDDNFSGLCWVAAGHGKVPPRAVIGGEDLGQPLYVARAKIDGRFVPGKLLLRYGLSYVAWDGKERELAEYEVLCYYTGNYHVCNANIPPGAKRARTEELFKQYDCGLVWVAAENGEVPPNAVVGGEEKGEPSYVIRATFKGELTPGKLAPGDGTCYVSWGGKAHSSSSYEVLCYFTGQTCNKENIPLNSKHVCINKSGACLVKPRCVGPGGCDNYFGLWWVAAKNGEVPARAVIGGDDNGEPVYVIRAQLKGGLVSGKLLVRDGLSHVPWCGLEFEMPRYQVLCYFQGDCKNCKEENVPFNAQRARVEGTDCTPDGGHKRSGYSGLCWVAARGGKLHPNAVIGGAEKGEPLYVTRTNFRGRFTPGKLLASHGTSKISWSGKEYASPSYEVLCYFPGDCDVCDEGNAPPNAEPAFIRESGWGPGFVQSYKQESTSYFGLCWVQSGNGTVPPNAVVGGERNKESFYVIRATHNGILTPGKVARGRGVSSVSWGGKEHFLSGYEVLCYYPRNCVACYKRNVPLDAQRALVDPEIDAQWGGSSFDLYWATANGGNVPPCAVIGGQELGEPLYVARAEIDGDLVPGKALGSHRTAYIPCDGKEHDKHEFEVLCYVPGDCQKCNGVNFPPHSERARTGGLNFFGSRGTAGYKHRRGNYFGL